MEIYKCDVCGRTVKKGELTELVEWLQTKEIKHACNHCLDMIEESNRKMKVILENSRKSWLRQLVDRLCKM